MFYLELLGNVSSVLIGLLVILLFFDAHYFVRSIFVVLWGMLFEDKIMPEDISTINGFCTTNDLDIMFRHMNNARYVRELDFARFRFYERSGIYRAINVAKGVALQSACTIKYRRSIPIFTPYRITTKAVYWDEKALYLEQQFITVKDNFVRAVSLSKQTVVGVNVAELLAQLLGKDKSYRPSATPEMDHFLALMDASSMRLRKKE